MQLALCHSLTAGAADVYSTARLSPAALLQLQQVVQVARHQQACSSLQYTAPHHLIAQLLNLRLRLLPVVWLPGTPCCL
jgi:hypothetical protein